MNKTIIAIIAICLLCQTASAARNLESIYHSKEDSINRWISLCNKYPTLCKYEFIGKSIQGKDIYMFKIGNPKGGKVMIESNIHGWEDSGNELTYQFASIILKDTDSRSMRIKQKNYLLIIPIVNMDTVVRTNARTVNPDGTKLCYGVDLNRNFEYGFGAEKKIDVCGKFPNNYQGYKALSEPESLAIRNAIVKYKPKAYLSIHMGGEPTLNYCKADTLTLSIKNKYVKMSTDAKTPYIYPTKQSCTAATSTMTASMLGASAFMTETVSTPNIPSTLDAFLKQWYKPNHMIFISMCEVVEI